MGAASFVKCPLIRSFFVNVDHKFRASQKAAQFIGLFLKLPAVLLYLLPAAFVQCFYSFFFFFSLFSPYNLYSAAVRCFQSSGAKVKVAVLGSQSLIVLVVAVDVKQHSTTA